MPEMFRNFAQRVEVSEHHGGSSFHRHQGAYAAIVLNGAYFETSADGPVWASAGDIIVHPPFHAHKNLFRAPYAKVLNIALSLAPALESGYRLLGRMPVVELERLVAADPHRAEAMILDRASGSPAKFTNHNQRLGVAAAALRADPHLSIAAAAKRAGYAHASFTRAFAQAYGGPPSAFRAEHRFRAALPGIMKGVALAEMAMAAGYCDQAHMTRDFRRRTGTSPAALRAESKFIQDGAV